MGQKKPSNRKFCTVCPKNKSKSGYDSEDDNRSWRSSRRSKFGKPPGSKKLGSKSRAMNRNMVHRIEKGRKAAKAVASKRAYLKSEIDRKRRGGDLSYTSRTIRPMALKTHNHYYGLDHLTEVPHPHTGDVFTNMVSGERYLFNKDVWNYIPAPPGPRAYYSDGFAREEIIPDPKNGDLYIQGATNQICIFQNGQWRSKVFVSPEIRETINMYQKPNRREEMLHRIDEDIDDSEDEENEQDFDENEDDENEDDEEDGDEKTDEVRESNLRVSLPLRHRLGEIGVEHGVPHLGSASKHFKLNFEKSQAWLEGTYLNLSVDTFEKIFPHISDNVANLQVLPQGMVDVVLKFERPHITPVEFKLETWIKYSDANGNLWQTVTCLADFIVSDDKGEEITEYELVPESGQKLVDLQQFHKTLTTLATRETILLKSEKPISLVRWKSKLLAYPVKAERKEFYAVQFNDLQKSITLPKLGVKID